MVDLDVIFIEAYSCPRCRAPLEARATGSPSWLRCPGCGRASLVPETPRRAATPFADASDFGYDGMTEGVASAALPIQPRGIAPLPPSSSSKTPKARLALGTGFFLATFLSLFYLLGSNVKQAGLFGFVAVVCLISLTRKPGRPSKD